VAARTLCFAAAARTGHPDRKRRRADQRDFAVLAPSRPDENGNRGETMHRIITVSFAASLATLGLGGAAFAQQQAPQSPNMTFFVAGSGPGKGGDLGGMDAADARCQSLAEAAGAGRKVWRAYLSSTPNASVKVINARDRIGKGPWQNFKSEVIAQNVDDLHGPGNKLSQDTALTERGSKIAGFGMTPNWHDAITGSTADGRAFETNMNLTCNNYTSNQYGKAMLGHIDRKGPNDSDQMRSWNASHMSRGCSQEDLVATGGNGLFYCFAAQ
jgi:hypothetical protein